MKALNIQLQYELDRFGVSKGDIETIFIGGGTPSTIKPSLYEESFKIISPYLKKDAEITTEANPNSATKEWLEGMRELGVNRVSFGVQSFDNKKLKILNRSHNSKEAIRAISSAKDVGYERISIDLIYAIRGDTKDSLKSDIDIAFTLPINHISAYELIIEDNTPFALKPNIRVDDENLSRYIKELIESNGLKQYEVSNYGDICLHNLGYWELKNYLGVGAGAVGFKDNMRFYTQNGIYEYISNPLKVDIEEIKAEDILLEKLLLGFRSIVGVDCSLLNRDMKERADILVKEGILSQNGNRYYCNDYLLADEAVLYISS